MPVGKVSCGYGFDFLFVSLQADLHPSLVVGNSAPAPSALAFEPEMLHRKTFRPPYRGRATLY